MDALQAQAMNLETRRRREIKLARIESAILRLDEDAFGDCVRCSEPISEERLNLDPSLLLCLSCAQAAET